MYHSKICGIFFSGCKHFNRCKDDPKKNIVYEYLGNGFRLREEKNVKVQQEGPERMGCGELAKGCEKVRWGKSKVRRRLDDHGGCSCKQDRTMPESWLNIALAAVFGHRIQRTRVEVGDQLRGVCKNTCAEWQWACGSEVVTGDQTVPVFTGKAETIVRWKEFKA